MMYERVYTVWDYYDGARSGIANYRNRPHYYVCEWDKDADDYAETFTLTPIDEKTLTISLEQWSIWREWEIAFHRGLRSQETHPALPRQNERYAELDALLKSTLPISGGPNSVRKRASFRPQKQQDDLPPGALRDLEVEWMDAT